MTTKESRRLIKAARDLYFAGVWTCDRDCDSTKLWEELRDAAHLPEGSATKEGVNG